MTKHEQLLSYMRGWHKGAGHHAFTDDEMRLTDFKIGFDAGRNAAREVYEWASKKYGAELLPIRPMTPSEIKHGVNCEKVIHKTNQGFLHWSDDDRPFDVDGVNYCGRCHQAL